MSTEHRSCVRMITHLVKQLPMINAVLTVTGNSHCYSIMGVLRSPVVEAAVALMQYCA
jgi:hypothetical protein